MTLINNKQKAIAELLALKITSSDELMAAKRRLAKKYGVGIISNTEILGERRCLTARKRNEDSPGIERILRKRAIRTMSGIAPVAVLTAPYPCPGRCAYCPAEKNVPQSYLSNEPAVMRAIRCGYDPYRQVRERLRALLANGHRPEKIELIVIGGTWSVLPDKYKYRFISECFRGANEFDAKHEARNTKHETRSMEIMKNRLLREQTKNERAKYRVIGITLETRPDYINEKELWQMRELGCTRVELGAQAIDDDILKANRRGHGVEEIARATRLLKNFGFKATYHIMPGLPGSSPAKDLRMFTRLFIDERFQPDQIKFYPTVVTRGSALYRWWRAGKYRPYSDKQLRNLIARCKQIVPPYVRIIRLIRDIPAESIVAGNRITNLRQIMQREGAKCKCIRCREARGEDLRFKNLDLRIINYYASGGEEYFLSYESEDGKTLYGFCRLRLNSRNREQGARNREQGARNREQGTWSTKQGTGNVELQRDAALIRELHVYGELVPVGGNKKVQHAGLGRKLMREAEGIARENGYSKTAVIAGIGVRGYYRRLGYRLSRTYMVKSI